MMFKPALGKAFMSLSLIARPQIEGPCFSSLMAAPGSSCVPWPANVDAFASWEKSRRFIFWGSAEEYLHVSDERGVPVNDLATAGRVVTESFFNDDRTMFYIGTDKGMVYGVDAFTFEEVFSFTADSKINNNFTEVSGLIFTSALGTIYCLDSKNGELKWHIEQPMTVERLRLMQRSNILPYGEKEEYTHVIVPHAEGYVSLVDVKSGTVTKKITLGESRSSKFLDVVAPMVWLKNHLWVASYGLGIFSIDVGTGKIRHSILENGVLELLSDGEKLFAAGEDALYSISSSGDILWETALDKIVSKVPRAAFPFDKFSLGAKRMFYGNPSRLLLNANNLIVAFSSGSVGVFDQSNGNLEEILGNSVGFASITKADDNILMVSKRGSLLKFHVSGVNP